MQDSGSKKGLNLQQNFVSKQNNSSKASSLFGGILKNYLDPYARKFQEEENKKFRANIIETYSNPVYKTQMIEANFDSDYLTFKDRTYFGANDRLPRNILKNMVDASKRAGIDPMDLITTVAMETRFDPGQVSLTNGGTGIKLTTDSEYAKFWDSARNSLAPSFEGYLLKKGYVPQKYVRKSSKGWQIDRQYSLDYFNSLPIDTLKKYKQEYDDTLNSQVNTKGTNIPFYAIALYLKRNGIQGYNPGELKGATGYGGFIKFRQGRMDRYKKTRNILMNESDLQNLLKELSK